MCVCVSAWACVECVWVDGRYDDLELVKQIGQGGFSFVFEATHHGSGERLALKVPADRLHKGHMHSRSEAPLEGPNATCRPEIDL